MTTGYETAVETPYYWACAGIQYPSWPCPPISGLDQIWSNLTPIYKKLYLLTYLLTNI